MAVLRYTKQQILDAIKGSAGVKVVISDRLQCNRQTLENYIKRYPGLADAIVNEREARLDLAELLILQNIQIQRQLQMASGAPVDSSDAWKLLDKLGYRRGYMTGGGGIDVARDAAGNGSKVTIREVVVELPKDDNLTVAPILGEFDLEVDSVDVDQ